MQFGWDFCSGLDIGNGIFSDVLIDLQVPKIIVEEDP